MSTFLRPSCREIAFLLSKVLPPQELAIVINGLLSCESNDRLSDRESELGQRLFNQLTEISPEATEIAQNS